MNTGRATQLLVDVEAAVAHEAERDPDSPDMSVRTVKDALVTVRALSGRQRDRSTTAEVRAALELLSDDPDSPVQRRSRRGPRVGTYHIAFRWYPVVRVELPVPVAEALVQEAVQGVTTHHAPFITSEECGQCTLLQQGADLLRAELGR